MSIAIPVCRGREQADTLVNSKRRIPQRTCVICRTTLPKRSLIRVVRSPEGRVSIDGRGKAAGRGAYVCPRAECFSSARARASLCRALEIDISVEDWAALSPDLLKLAQERGAASASIADSGSGSVGSAEGKGI
ncbi:MAG: RNase P modulator RnpM [Anaerolineae bacterium]